MTLFVSRLEIPKKFNLVSFRSFVIEVVYMKIRLYFDTYYLTKII